jgi:hypothetical protein
MKALIASLLTFVFSFSPALVWACAQCRPVINARVYNQHFTTNLFLVLLPLAVLFLIGFGLYFSDRILIKSHKN